MEKQKVISGVFDKVTIDTLYWMANTGRAQDLEYCIATGKEADVYRAKDSKGRYIAVKLYRIETSNFEDMLSYVEGDPRFEHVRKEKRALIFAWCRKEYSNLKRMHDHGVNVPEPYNFRNNVLTMEFIGTRGAPAPMLKNSQVEDPEKMLKDILEEMRKIRESGLVHADLSEYNILVKDSKPVIIDVGQAVLQTHPRAKEFLERDIRNISTFFRKNGVKDAYEVFERWNT